MGEQTCVLEGQFLHEEVNSRVYFKTVEVVGITLQPHEEATVRHVGGAGKINNKSHMNLCRIN